MMAKIRKSIIAGLTMLCLSASIAVAASSVNANAAGGDIFSAGNKSGPGGAICSCPVLVGDCVCHVKGPKAIDEVEAE
jgi:hypothetical protein